MLNTAPGLSTIGHSNLALDDFLGLLQQHGIQTVADVRTVPRSRYVPHFNAGQLHEALARCDISYLPFGRELGGRPEGSEFYDAQGHVLYGRLAESPAFGAGIDRILAGAQTQRIALLCSEEDPARCHRHLLIGRVLGKRGVAVAHIRRDGRIETESDLAAREISDVPQATLFDGDPGERQWKSPRPVRSPPD
ncbi:MAG TPA: DUF488 domain-containing protein [Streptosporangiaceae bacterium]|nr:DUF488 domain-containing protein [Streptosporangiaceae bacterium]